MRRPITPLLLPVLLLAALLLGGCASTQIKSTWRDEHDTGGAPRKLAVFVAVKDENLRKMAENRVVQSLPKSANAMAGHQMELDPQLETEAIRKHLIQGGFDGALVSRLVSVDKSQAIVPAQTYFMTDSVFWGAGPRYRNFYSYYPYAYTSPTYTVENTRIIVETLLYRLPEGKPVWTAISESANPQTSLQIVDELIVQITKKLKEEGLLAPN